MRSYYHSHRWSPAYSPAPAPLPQGGTRPAGSRRAVVFFAASLAVILILLITLAALSGQGAGAATPPAGDTPSWYDFDEDAYAGIPPSISQAEPDAGVTLPLISSAGRDAVSIQDNYLRNIDTIVGIHVYGSSFDSFGTGVVMTEDGYIITNAHVVEGGSRVVASLYDGTHLGCDLVGFDPYSDLAVLKTYPSVPLSPAEFGDSDELQVGDPAFALGNPLGTELWGTMTDGIISAINRNVEMDDGTTMTLIQTTAAINSGNSGGALLNDRGQVIGITNMKIIADDNTIEGLGFAIPSSTVKEVADSMIATGTYLGTPSIGITGTVSPGTEGVLVYSVNPRSDAAAQGVQAGDIITAVNGQRVFSVDEINRLKEGLSVGDPLTLTLLRDGKTLTIRLQLVGAYSLN